MPIPAETFFLSGDREATLQQQIQQVIAEAILSGRCLAGEKMPSTRHLAQHLGVARITVTNAYTDLVADEYLVARGRSGFYVSDSAPQRPVLTPEARAGVVPLDWSRKLGQRFSDAMPVLRPANWSDYRYPFIYGQTDPKLFDHANWRACAIRAVGRKDFDSLATDHYERDDAMLVEFLLRQILPRRGISARPEEILITMGAQHALWMTAQILLTQRRTAVLEDPCYPGMRHILNQSRCQIRNVAVDGWGLPPDAIPPEADVVFTTPSHHCPTNVTMPLARRRDLLARAERDGFVIVEDDYEFEMSFLKPPSPALKSLDRAGSVVYMGSFSKSIFPGLRIGYLVAPEPFITEARALRSMVLRHPPGHMQRTTAYFLSLGHFDAQIARMARSYRQRRAVMEQALRDHGLLDAAAEETFGGSSFWMRAPEGVDMGQVALKLRQSSVLIEPGEAFFAGGAEAKRHYRLAYSSIPAARIEEGVALIARAIAEAQEEA
ncbi:PLP-dependent aminotransferase family protein [Pseudooceanicola sp. CBS1P-1]|uniref:Aminotransferase class I/II-fold pyridoxal phosphate-dependent enzyme n=1 Tax=Pseudooceanicola albus TaxID=2692189 RepID=A0A6L7G1W2_9RHOB|nr:MULTISPECIES: PLP-dependent aminotransferase family protein [Pseudooceanicola]MBT9383664.1 PLP-dependent aminotransferase family protein [Pseudooceanicola endophyticus]MXN17518.1 aminotransferase class I/II-fold pyridoxal phosphate-dependent enzyme [Pseudooceanicola albus]